MRNFNEKLALLVASIEKECSDAKWSLEKFESNPERFAPQLQNMRHHLRTAGRLSRSLHGMIKTQQLPINN